MSYREPAGRDHYLDDCGGLTVFGWRSVLPRRPRLLQGSGREATR